jgi:hypothetical protein
MNNTSAMFAVDLYSVPLHVGGISYADFGRKWSQYHATSASAFSRCSLGLLGSKVSTEMFNRRRLITWPHSSPDLTPLHFFFWEHVKDAVHVPPLPTTLPKLDGSIYKLLQLQLHPPFLQMCRLNLTTDMC